MLELMGKIGYIFLAWVLLLFFFRPLVQAQAEPAVNLNLANTYEVADEEVVDGDIIAQVRGSGELVRATSTREDTDIFGVVVFNPPIVYRTGGQGIPIIRGGETLVNVTTLGGAIQPGDLIVVSAVAGKGQKATESPHGVVGVALGSFSGQGAQILKVAGRDIPVGQVQVALKMGEPAAQLRRIVSLYLEDLGLSALDVFTNPQQVGAFARFIIAGLLLVFTLGLSFRYFGRNVTQGLEAMGRNPLASRKIQTMVLLNVFLIATVAIGAIVLALFIVRY